MKLLMAFWGRLNLGKMKSRLLLQWKRNLEAGFMRKMTWSVHYHVLSFEYSFFHLFSCHFSSGVGRKGSSPRITRDTSWSTAISENFLAPHQDWTKKGWGYNHLNWSLGELLAAFPWGSQQDLHRQSFPRRSSLDRHGQTTVAGTSQFRREVVIIQGFANFTAVHFVMKYHTVHSSGTRGKWGAWQGHSHRHSQGLAKESCYPQNFSISCRFAPWKGAVPKIVLLA